MKKPIPNDVIQSAIDTLMVIPGRTRKQASRELLDSLNADLGTRYHVNDWGKWKRGDRQLPPYIHNWLLRVALVHAIESCGGRAPFDDAQIDLLADKLTPPKRSTPASRKE